MSLKLTIDGASVPIVLRRFPAGETFLRLEDPLAHVHNQAASVEAHVSLEFEGNDDLFNLALLVDALRRQYSKTAIHLIMLYLPYARQDRVCSPGESLSVKVVADFINSLKLDCVYCWNIHSDVGAAVLDNLQQRESHYCFNLSRFDKQNTILVSPDAGANKKVLSLAKLGGFPNVVRADKTRDVMTGKITGTAVYSEHVGNKDFLILDDICDGGRTFTELARELHKLTTGKVMLYVTHGIFSSGVETLDSLFDKMYITNPVGATGKAAVESGKVTVI